MMRRGPEGWVWEPAGSEIVEVGTIVRGARHHPLMCDGGLLIDPTVEQFPGGDEVLIVVERCYPVEG